jgi:hypothetical protein
MKLLYEASNSIEAHLILQLIEQAGYAGRIDGEFLQGGIGELQAMGVVRVMVDENDYESAKVIVMEWDAAQPQNLEMKQEHGPKRTYSLGPAFIGLVLGILITVFLLRTPVTQQGIDHNGDGQLDEKWTYLKNVIYKTEIDRNLDGETDYIFKFDQRGLIKSSSSDENFDGEFETRILYKNGSPYSQVSDTDNDGFGDYHAKYENGVLDTITLYDPKTKKVVKVQEYNLFKLERALLDDNADGNLNLEIKYDQFEEIETITDMP